MRWNVKRSSDAETQIEGPDRHVICVPRKSSAADSPQSQEERIDALENEVQRLNSELGETKSKNAGPLSKLLKCAACSVIFILISVAVIHVLLVGFSVIRIAAVGGWVIRVVIPAVFFFLLQLFGVI